ncbi:glycine/betaine/sarcosine/D-proline family reductase selenoprotein B [Flindersiella endophytica]
MPVTATGPDVCALLPPSQLVHEILPITDVRTGGADTSWAGGTLTVAADIADGIEVPLVTELAVDVLPPAGRDVTTDTVLDVMPLAVKVEGRLGTGITRLARGAVLLVTGVDEAGEQLGEAGNSAGLLAGKLADAAAGTPDPGDWIIRVAVTIAAGTRMERRGPAAAHQAADQVAERIRAALLAAPDDAIRERRTYAEPGTTDPGRPRIALVKLVMGQGAMHDNLLLPAQPAGVRGGRSIIDLGNAPVVLRTNEIRDGALHSLCCVGPSSKETTLHYFRDPLLDVLASDPDLWPAGVIVVGSPHLEAGKQFVAARVGAAVEALDVAGAIVATEGFGNNHIDFAAEISEIARISARGRSLCDNGTPTVGVCWSAARGMVVGNVHMTALVEVNKGDTGQETDVLGENTAATQDAHRAVGMLKSLLAGHTIEPAPARWDPDLVARNQKLVDHAYPQAAAGLACEVPIPDTRPVPLVHAKQALGQTTVTLVTAAAAHVHGDQPFAGYGDYSLREIRGDTPRERIVFSSGSYDHTDVNQDPNCLYPLQRLRELAAAGVIGAVAGMHYAMQGGGSEIELVAERTATELVARLRADGSQAVVLTGGCGSCHRAAVTLQRAIETAGIPTVIIASLPTVAAQMGAPRVLGVDTPMGAALGRPGDVGQQTRILRQALEFLGQAETAGEIRQLAESYYR